MENYEGLQFYRCILCGHIISVWDIRSGRGCQKCGCRRMRPSDLSLWEKVVQLAKHPKFWTWKDERI